MPLPRFTVNLLLILLKLGWWTDRDSVMSGRLYKQMLFEKE